MEGFNVALPLKDDNTVTVSLACLCTYVNINTDVHTYIQYVQYVQCSTGIPGIPGVMIRQIFWKLICQIAKMMKYIFYNDGCVRVLSDYRSVGM